jgi:hypothetical protein
MQNAALQYGGAQERAMANQQNAYQKGIGWQALGQEGLTKARVAEQGSLSDFYGNQATQTSDLLTSLMQNRLKAEQQQADLSRRALLDQADVVGAGYEAATGAEDTAWKQNQYNQWANQFDYWGQLAGANTQAGVNAATGNAMNAWNIQSNNDFRQQQLDLARDQMYMQTIQGLTQ